MSLLPDGEAFECLSGFCTPHMSNARTSHTKKIGVYYQMTYYYAHANKSLRNNFSINFIACQDKIEQMFDEFYVFLSKNI